MENTAFLDLTLLFLSPHKTKRPFFHKKNNHTSLISTIVEQLRPCFVDQRTTPPIQERPLFHCAPIKRHESSRDQTRKNKGIKVYQPNLLLFLRITPSYIFLYCTDGKRPSRWSPHAEGGCVPFIPACIVLYNTNSLIQLYFTV